MKEKERLEVVKRVKHSMEEFNEIEKCKIELNALMQDEKVKRYIKKQNKKIVAGAGRYVLVTADQEDWSGTYLIAYKSGSTVRLLDGKSSGGDYAAMAAALSVDSFDGDNILALGTTDPCACTIEKTTNGYSIQSRDGYMGMTKADNKLWFSSTFVASQYEWTIAYDTGTEKVKIQNVSFPDRYLQANISSPRFAGYKGTQQNLTLYKYIE